MKQHSARELVLWGGRVMGGFLRVRPFTTIVVVLISAFARVTRLLAFFLPLKVILLAGSEGVPRYFRFFIDPADKDQWIVILSILSVVFYAGTLIQEWAAAQLSSSAASDVMRGATELALIKDQEAEVRDYYVHFCGIAANLIFSTVGLVVGLFIRPSVFIALALMIGVQVGVTLAAVGDARGRGADRFRQFLERNLSDYVKALVGLNFLVGFFLILWPFVRGTEANVLLAILSVLIVRQSLKTVSGAVVGLHALSRERHRIDVLVFPGVQFQRTERAEQQALRQHFGRKERHRLAVRELRDIARTDQIAVRWHDSAIRGVSKLEITLDNGDGGVQTLHQHIYSPRHLHLLKNEQLLFRHMKREVLKAPPVIARFEEGAFSCQVCAAGPPLYQSAHEWHRGELKLLEYYWGCKPTRRLIRTFTSARPLLHKRLTPALVARLEVAVDDDRDAAELETFCQSLQWVVGRVKRVPLYVHNPDLNRESVVRSGSGDVYVMNWGRWRLEPIGVGFEGHRGRAKVESMLAAVRAARDDVPEDITAHDLLLVSACRRLELNINRELYKRALAQIPYLNRRIRHIQGLQAIKGQGTVEAGSTTNPEGAVQTLNSV